MRLSAKESETVYEPSEDSFLLIDALEQDMELIERAGGVCLEIGSGSGVVISALAKALKSRVFCLACDINPNACEVTQRTALENGSIVDVVQMNLAGCFTHRGIFDVVVFNPPYVVTESLELLEKDLIYKTWAGGKNGREVMERVFPHIPSLLSDRGVFYLLVIKENDPVYIIEFFRPLGMVGKIVKERKIRGEHLYVLRFCNIDLVE